MATVLVVGSPYRLSTGRIIARHAAERGHTVRYLTDPEGPGERPGEDPFAGADGIVLVPHRGDPRRHTEGATRTVLARAARHGTSAHLVLFSSFAVGHGPAHPLNRLTPTLLPSRLVAEELVRGSGRPHTVVRPTWMTDDPPGSHAVTLTRHPHADGMIARADMAAVIVAALEEPAARGTTFTLFNEPGPAPVSFAEAFAALARDPREGPS
ncbi:NAD(P)H-binding protein (plasmid) [Streptomyces sp. BI20]|uniref:NAD(P)H-binding protein n=1 Tax=Streptomyces sp. BI20 TaxID=3403460 RepID=UPI003C76930E